jgi:hypothetical protein
MNSMPCGPDELTSIRDDPSHPFTEHDMQYRLHADIARGRNEIITMLSEYGSGRNDLILMLRDLSTQDNHERIIRDMDAERELSLRASLQLELDEQIKDP